MCSHDEARESRSRLRRSFRPRNIAVIGDAARYSRNLADKNQTQHRRIRRSRWCAKPLWNEGRRERAPPPNSVDFAWPRASPVIFQNNIPNQAGGESTRPRNRNNQPFASYAAYEVYAKKQRARLSAEVTRQAPMRRHGGKVMQKNENRQVGENKSLARHIEQPERRGRCLAR